MVAVAPTSSASSGPAFALSSVIESKSSSNRTSSSSISCATSIPPSSGVVAAATTPDEGGMEVAQEMDEEEVRLEELLDSMTLDNANAGPDEADDVGATATIYVAAAAPAPNTKALPSLEDDPDL